MHDELVARYDASRGLLVHTSQTRFSVAEHFVESNHPTIHAVQGVQVALVVCRTALEYEPDGHCT
jgi:hypothetical protein